MEYCFSRQPFSPDANMVAVQMQFTNNATSDTKNLHIEDVKLQSGMRVKEFPEIGKSRELIPDQHPNIGGNTELGDFSRQG